MGFSVAQQPAAGSPVNSGESFLLTLERLPLWLFREVLPKTTWLQFVSYSSASFQHSFYQSLNTAALASPRTCWTDSRVRLSISRRSRPTSRFFPGREDATTTTMGR